MGLAFVPPMLPTLVDEAPEGNEWIHEIKYDGWRTQIVIDHGSIKVFTRNGHDWTDKFAPIAAAAASLPAFTAILDGEMIVTDVEGKPDFGALKGAIKAAPGRLTFVAFDLLLWNGRDLRARKLIERRRQLWSLVEPAQGKIQFSHEIVGEGSRFLAQVEAMGLEGIVSKRADSSYQSGRTREWVKIKSFVEATFDIIGVQREPGQPAMVLMANAEGRYIGGAFVTLPRGIRERLWARVKAKAGAPGPMGIKADKAEWVKPGLRGRVKFLRGEEKLRHASLQDWSESS
ncbi:MAG: ATP-dependent DNA ligase [Mesorhizobium sp.]|nr:ATP-dependent DNA ligase [Mesorhizobium sp.]